MWDTLKIEVTRSGAVRVTAGDTTTSFARLDEAMHYTRERTQRKRTQQDLSRTID